MGDFHQHHTVDELAAEQLDEDERQAFVDAADDRPRGYYCQHMLITSGALVGIPTVGCGCAMLALTG